MLLLCAVCLPDLAIKELNLASMTTNHIEIRKNENKTLNNIFSHKFKANIQFSIISKSKSKNYYHYFKEKWNQYLTNPPQD